MTEGTTSQQEQLAQTDAATRDERTPRPSPPQSGQNGAPPAKQAEQNGASPAAPPATPTSGQNPPQQMRPQQPPSATPPPAQPSNQPPQQQPQATPPAATPAQTSPSPSPPQQHSPQAPQQPPQQAPPPQQPPASVAATTLPGAQQPQTQPGENAPPAATQTPPQQPSAQSSSPQQPPAPSAPQQLSGNPQQSTPTHQTSNAPSHSAHHQAAHQQPASNEARPGEIPSTPPQSPPPQNAISPKAPETPSAPAGQRPSADTGGAPDKDKSVFTKPAELPSHKASGASRVSGQNEVEALDESKALVVQDFSTDIAKRQGQELQKQQSGELDEAKAQEAKQQSRLPLGERLITKGLISRDQLEVALKVQRESEDQPMIGQIMVQLGFITESALGELLTEHNDVERFDPKSTIIDPNLIKQVPKEVAERYRAAPILLNNDNVYVAMQDIYNVIAIDRIQRYFPKRFKMVPVHCSEGDLMEIIDNYYDYELSIDGILREMEALRNDEEELSKLTDQDNYTNPTVRLIDSLLVDAIRAGASDMHFEPEGSFVRLRYRIDGTLRLIRSFHKDYWSAIVVRVKIISDMNITESRMPQDGRITLQVLGREISFRVATQPTIHGENLVLRILDKKKALLPMDVLGFSEPNLKLLEKALKRPEGVIIVTGPTGSGKSTTLYSILQYINRPEVNIMTLEDPVEYELPMIRQSNIREGTGLDFVSGIKSLMRQDPDIIFVGEVRDLDTATMAVRAAMTGHQVYTSLHTNDALGALPRLTDIGVKPEMLSSNIICSIAQRLARKLCTHCKEEHEPNEEERRILGLEKSEKSTKIYKNAGCEKCDYTGYKGRIAISEVILVDAELDEMIFRNAAKGEMLKYISQNGFIPMAEDGVEKVLKGITDIDELIRTINVTDRL